MTLPTHYTTLIKTLHDRFDKLETEAMTEAQNKIENIRLRRTANTSKVTEFTASFLDTGIFILQFGSETYEVAVERGYYKRGYTTLNLYARELAKQLKRPFVRLYGDRLLIPKTKKLSILTTPFMFVAQKAKPRYHEPPQQGVVEHTHYSSLYCYEFRGREGIEWRDTFLKYIREPECRRVLGLTSEV